MSIFENKICSFRLFGVGSYFYVYKQPCVHFLDQRLGFQEVKGHSQHNLDSLDNPDSPGTLDIRVILDKAEKSFCKICLSEKWYLYMPPAQKQHPDPATEASRSIQYSY